MSINNEFIEITNQNGVKMKLEISWENDVWAWVDTFKVILKWLGFAEVTIEKAFGKNNES